MFLIYIFFSSPSGTLLMCTLIHLKFPTFLWGSVSISSFHFFLCISRASYFYSSISQLTYSFFWPFMSTVSPSNEFWSQLLYFFTQNFHLGIFQLLQYRHIYNIKLEICFWHLDPLIGSFFSLVFPLYFLVVVHFPIMDQIDISLHLLILLLSLSLKTC